MRHYALIGHILTHSYSKQLFDAQHFADADYRLCPMPSLEGLREWVRRERIGGFNVTNPYKQAILPLLDELSPEARTIGAVNCVIIEEVTGRLVGHNTDAPAFRDTLSTFHSPLSTFHSAFILGTGGAARAVAYALGQQNIPFAFVSRTPERWKAESEKWEVIGYDQLSTFHFPLSTLIVNATPVGTYPDIDCSPLDITQAIKQSSNQAIFVYDLVYNPSPTLLMRQAAAAGATTCDGLAMLHRQAELSWQLWKLGTENGD